MVANAGYTVHRIHVDAGAEPRGAGHREEDRPRHPHLRPASGPAGPERPRRRRRAHQGEPTVAAGGLER